MLSNSIHPTSCLHWEDPQSRADKSDKERGVFVLQHFGLLSCNSLLPAEESEQERGIDKRDKEK